MKPIIVGLMIIVAVGWSWGEGVFCRYQAGDQTCYGRVQGDTIHQLSSAPWDGGVETGHIIPVTKVKLLHPSEPRIILGMSGTYQEAWASVNPFKTVRWFLKPPSAAASPGDDVVLPAALDELLVETELVIVIGKTVKNADPPTAKQAIFGYTVGNDIVGSVTSYHAIAGEPLDQPETLLSSGLKMGDRFSPYGPYIYTNVDWNNRNRRLVVKNPATNKEIVYEHNTNRMIYPPEKIVSDLSKVMTLNPGDVIFSGTTQALPAREGDIMEVSVEGLGTLMNRVTK